MAEHLGHLVQMPSGISRFLDLEPPILGFLMNVVSVLGGGGVTAGSTVSSPSVFLENEVVAMFGIGSELLGSDQQTTRDGPYTDVRGSSLAKHPRASAGGGASGQHVIDKDNPFAVQGHAGLQFKGP